MFETRCWGVSLVKVLYPWGTCFPSHHKIVPPQAFPACCPPRPPPSPAPKGCESVLPTTAEGRGGRRDGAAAGPLPATRSPHVWAPGSRIRSGLSDVKAVAETSRKLKAKGEIPYWNRTAPCFTKIWHRRGTNNGCCVTRLYVLYHLSKPQT